MQSAAGRSNGSRITSAPRCFAVWIAKLATPPAPPCTRIVSPDVPATHTAGGDALDLGGVRPAGIGRKVAPEDQRQIEAAQLAAVVAGLEVVERPASAVLLAVGVFAAVELGGTGFSAGSMGRQLGVQAIGVLATIAWSGGLSYVLLKLIDAAIGLRVDAESETTGLDLSQHEERGYDL